MIESIGFSNYKALRKAHLPLAPFTLLLGPNGSGKSSVLQALQGIAPLTQLPAQGNGVIPAGSWNAKKSVTVIDSDSPVLIKLRIRLESKVFVVTFEWHRKDQGIQVKRTITREDGTVVSPADSRLPLDWLSRIQTFALDPQAIAQSVNVSSGPIQANGTGLAAVLDDIKDNHPERWEMLVTELTHWLPEYDYILFDKPKQGQKSIVLRTKTGGHRIRASELSQGSLVALAFLTLAYLPKPPSLIGLEEIDRGLHPRLLRHLQDALYRLSYPESCGENRAPIQVIATTHSPYLLDLYREHPEEVVLAQKEGLEVKMRRLSEIEHYKEILGESPLSEVWYSGVLGGVSVKP